MKSTTITLFLALVLAGCNADSPQTDPGLAEGEATTTQADTPCVLKPPGKPMACTMVWRPVCGCNGVTYSNSCSARAAGVPSFTEGECRGERLD